MARLPLLLYPNQELRLGSDPVGIEWARSEEFKRLLADMVETMVWYRGVGFSAIQAGIQDRAFVMKTRDGVLKLVDPIIEYCDGDLVELREGCLSVPGVVEIVKRYQEVTVSALDIESGERRHYSMEGVEAQCVQHEMEHLDGKMFTDGYGLTKRDLAKRKIRKEVKFNPIYRELS